MSPSVFGGAAAALAAFAIVLSRSPLSAGAPVSDRHPDARPLNEIGWTSGLSSWERRRMAVTLGVLGAALALSLPPWLSAVAVVAPSVWVRLRARAARERARRAFTRAVAGIEGALRSGSSLPDGFRREISACADPLARHTLDEILRTFDLGEALDVAIRRAAGDLRDGPSVVLLETLAIGVEERLASARLVDLLAATLDRQQFMEQLADEVQARARGVRQQQWLLAILVPAIAVVLVGSLPALAEELGTELGRFVLVPAAAMLEVLGVVVAGRIVRDAVE